MKRAVAYLRVSTSKQADKDFDPEGYSLPAQREACYRRAQDKGAEVVAEYMDRGESAKTADRPEFQRLLKRVRTNRDIDYVIVDKVDRFARNVRDAVNLIHELKAAGCQLISVKENIDETPGGQLQFTILAGIAEYFSNNNGAEALKGMTQKAKVGGTPGLAPIGYLNVRQMVDGREIRTIAVDPDRAPLVRWAFDAYATGDYTILELVDELARRGLRSPQGNKVLKKALVGKMLNNRYYVGIVTFRGAEYPGRHESIVPPEVFARVQGILSGRRYAGEKQRHHQHYLKGSIFCGECGSRLSMTFATGRSGGTYLYFFCLGRQRRNGCVKRFVQSDLLETEVEELYENAQLTPEEATKLRAWVEKEAKEGRALRKREAERQKARLERLRVERETLMEALYAKAVPMDLFSSEQERITREMAKAEQLADGAAEKFSMTARTILRAIDLAESLHATYVRSPERIRRLVNQAWWSDIKVKDRPARAEGRMTEHASALFHALPNAIGSRVAEAAQAVSSAVGLSENVLVRLEGLEPPTF